MKLWILTTFCTASLLILSGCGAKATPKKEAVIDETLPIVILTKNGTIADMNAIALEWNQIEDQRVKGVYIYKIALNAKGDNKDEYYDTVSNRFSTHYLDTDIKPDSQYSYYFKTYSNSAESRKSEATLISSLPVMDSVTWIHSIQNMPRSAKIIWRPHTNEKVKEYIIQRRTLEDEKWRDVVTVKGRLNAEYIDKKLKDKFTYKYRIRAVTYDDIVSKPSQEVNVTTKALPNELTQIIATTDLAKKIEIKWEATRIKDFLFYRIYRASSVNGDYKKLLDTKDNFYVDTIEEDGKVYFYRVSVFDMDRLESISKNYSVLGRTLIKPAQPSLVEAKLVDGKVKISWTNSDKRVKSYSVQKRYKKSLFENSIEDFEDIKGLEFVDSEIEPDKTYYYKVFSVDANDIKSAASIEVELKVEKSITNNSQLQLEQTIEVKKSYDDSAKDVITPMQDFN